MEPVPPRNKKRGRESAEVEGRVTRAAVDLHAIMNNVRVLRECARTSRLMTVVKANGYGHGAVAIARAALDAGADWLGVYTVEEGRALRKAGLSAPTLVFGPFGAAEARIIAECDLRATVTGLQSARLLASAARETIIRYHLKVDTGLHRAGVADSEALTVMRSISSFPNLRAEGIYTHLASADETDRGITTAQLACFRSVIGELTGEGFSFELRHAANSAATMAYPESHFDLVRCGLGTYGYYPSTTINRVARLQPAMVLQSAISRIHAVPPDTGIGYGHEFRTRRPSIIALVPIGYGDGLPRALGLGVGRALVRGAFAPIVGRISMDQITLDVTEIPDARWGDEVVIIGGQGDHVQTADDLAAQMGTISYEILSGIMPRVPRLYRLPSDIGMPGGSQ